MNRTKLTTIKLLTLVFVLTSTTIILSLTYTDLLYTPNIAPDLEPTVVWNTHNTPSTLENATLLSLVRNSELEGMLSSISHVESRFNHQFHYDWHFLNNEPFTEEFQQKVAESVSGRAFFTQIPPLFWDVPSSIDTEKMQQSMDRLKSEKVLYADQLSYRQMCRFNSGFFYRLETLQQYRYYWRIEPNVEFNCDIPYDPFTLMRTRKKKYGFNMALVENRKTIRQLWTTTLDFFHKNPELRHENSTLDFVTHDFTDGTVHLHSEDHSGYNLCHFWSNFEIADLDFFRSQQYAEYFKALDETGNFFYERWGDAPIHTLAVSFLLEPSDLHYFEHTGYYHKPNLDCPSDDKVRDELNCRCSKNRDFSFHKWSCVPRYFEVFNLTMKSQS